ncbi:MFS transporter [Kineococcus aurantiacus]|uniref:MFS family permease n=1 Tax=Kineococcus aurantiacus TaxID=37633 RepID=A0A7Y9DL98_9ACTN|nr:MFS family permease [Kineococcus aurantiacus]
MPSDRPAPVRIPRAAWLTVSSTALGLVVAFSSVSMVPVALPAMIEDLDASGVQGQWFLLAYLLACSALILVAGRVADACGRRPVYLTGLALCTLSVAGTTFASDPWLVVALRGVQGLGAACVITNSTALLVEVFPPSRLAVGIGANIGIMSVATAIGPLVSGVLTEAVGWRAVFAVGAPLGLVGLVWAGFALPRVPRAPRRAGRPDVAGALASATLMAAVVFGANQAGASGWTPTAVGALVVAAAAGAVLLLVERRAGDPVVDLGLLRERFRGSAYGATGLSTLAEGSVAVVVVWHLQQDGGSSPLEAGVQVTALAVGTATASLVAGRLSPLFSGRALTTAAVTGSTVVLALIALHFAGPAESVPLWALLCAIGLTGGIFKTANAAALNVGGDAGQAGMVNGLRVAVDNTAVTVAVAVGLAITGSAGVVVCFAVLACLSLLAVVPAWNRGLHAEEPFRVRATQLAA